jgi:3-phosphoglycerate kinase
MPPDLDGAGLRIGIVQARFNAWAGQALAQACLDELLLLGVDEDDITRVTVPGALEVPLTLARLADAFVNDAFSAAHRAHASTEGVARLLPAYAGRLMEAELKALDAALGNPARPVVAIVGGAKVSTKLELLGNLCSKVDVLVIGGAMANTFLAAQGHGMGKSLQEAEMHATARQILEQAKAANCEILLPVDLVVAEEFRANPPTRTVGVDRVPANMMALDVGPQSVAALEARLRTASTLVWNGPLGAFEIAPFDAATVAAAQTVAALTQSGALKSIAGGGDTVAALRHAGVLERMSYVSTAGGAFLEWLEGKELPGVAALACAVACGRLLWPGLECGLEARERRSKFAGGLLRGVLRGARLIAALATLSGRRGAWHALRIGS